MAVYASRCHWAQPSFEEDNGIACRLHIRFSLEVALDSVAVHVSRNALRIVREPVADVDAGVETDFLEIPLPKELLEVEFCVKRHRRSHELRIKLPWANGGATSEDVCTPSLGAKPIRYALAGLSRAEDVAVGLRSSGYHVVDSFLGSEASFRIAKLAAAWHEGGRLAPGVVGTAAAPLAPLANVRGDVMTLLKEGDDPDVAALLRKIDALVLSMTRQIPKLACVTQRSRAMLAVYPPGSGGYLRHVDNRVGSDPEDTRRLTCIYYVNSSWCEAHGGALRLHVADGPLDVAPLADRFVCFWADGLEHEVLATHAVRRAAVSAWYSEVVPEGLARIPRQLPANAVHGLAAELLHTGMVLLPSWILHPMGPLSPAELASVSRAVHSAGKSGTSRDLSVLGEHYDSLHAALGALSDVSASCYCDSSRVVAACVECAERLFGMLIDSEAPGWTSLKRPAGPARSPKFISFAETHATTSASLELKTGCALCCVFGLATGGSSAGPSSCDVLSFAGKCVQVGDGDVLLLCKSPMAPVGRWQTSGTSSFLRLEISFQ